MRISKRNYQKNIYQVIVFLFAFVPRIICTFFMVPVKVLMDDICTLNGAAYFAGLDWSNVVDKGSYYGFGFYALLSFVFKLTDNPYVLFYFILLILSLLQSMTALICFHILLEKFKIKEYKWCAFVAVTCSYMVVTRASYFANETPLMIITWSAIWLVLLLCEYQNNKRKKAIYTFLLILLLSYSLLIHTRAVTYWIAFLILIVLYGLVYRTCLISIPVFIGTAIVAVPIGQYFIKAYQNNIWDSTKTIVNASINVSMPVFDFNNMKGIMNIILGELNTIGVYTGGISYIAIIVCICILINCLRRNEKIASEYNQMFAIIIFCCVCVGITIVGMIPSWGMAVTYGLIKETTTDYYSYKAFTYIRYFGPYLGPLLMVMLLFARQYKKEICKISFIAICFMIPIQFYWMNSIIPYIAQNSTTYSAFMLFALWNEDKELGSYIYYTGIICMIFIPFIYERLIYKKRELASVILVLSILLAQYFYGIYAEDIAWAKKNIIQADAGYDWIKELEKKIELPSEIYVQDNIATSHHKSYYIYQFMLNRYFIIAGEPEETTEEVILFENTDENAELLQSVGFEYKQLDENEYVFVKGEELKARLRNVGIDFKK